MVAHGKDYNEFMDKSLPVYVITCLDNLFSPFNTIDIQAVHCRNDGSAKTLGWKLSEEQKWHSWEIFCGEREVFFINTNTGEKRG